MTVFSRNSVVSCTRTYQLSASMQLGFWLWASQDCNSFLLTYCWLSNRLWMIEQPMVVTSTRLLGLYAKAGTLFLASALDSLRIHPYRLTSALRDLSTSWKYEVLNIPRLRTVLLLSVFRGRPPLPHTCQARRICHQSTICFSGNCQLWLAYP